jgi:hypothetical protein
MMMRHKSSRNQRDARQIVKAALNSAVIDPKASIESVSKLVLETEVQADYVFAWDNYVFVVSAPDDDEDDGGTPEPACW